MRHNRKEVIGRTIREFKHLEDLVANLTDKDWQRLVPRPETKEPWTVKDSLAHITHWKADVIRSIRGQPRPPEERGLSIGKGNHLIYMRWRNRSPREVLAWHRQVQKDLLAALKDAPDEWFNGKERRAEWPNDLDGHSAYHRVKDIEQALQPENVRTQKSKIR
ncbi:MAG TPA: maleylpyruvate isomerase N-terminal domain-containing protein [Anaerolineales bacterium]|nr:maleylpyruvate isomerase N-terminal domain-containing protein [Anaerolineales bacterium]